jgi:hypothetical protein
MSLLCSLLSILVTGGMPQIHTLQGLVCVQRSRLLKAAETDSKPEIMPSTRPVLSFSEKLAFEGRPLVEVWHWKGKIENAN